MKIFNKKILYFICVSVLVLSLTKIGLWYMENRKLSSEVNKLNQVALVSSNEVYNRDEFLNIDFNDVLKENSNTVGWIYVHNTKINYAVLQTSDNAYYLNHTFYGKKNTGGWIFMDYRNNIVSDRNTIIYGHERKNGEMFGTLKNALDSNWVSDPNNMIIKFSTPNKEYLYEIFSVYKIPVTNDYIKTDFNSDQEYMDFLKMIKKRSLYDFNVKLDTSDKILTLSSCFGDTKKMVIHAKLIKSK